MPVNKDNIRKSINVIHINRVIEKNHNHSLLFTIILGVLANDVYVQLAHTSIHTRKEEKKF